MSLTEHLRRMASWLDDLPKPQFLQQCVSPLPKLSRRTCEVFRPFRDSPAAIDTSILHTFYAASRRRRSKTSLSRRHASSGGARALPCTVAVLGAARRLQQGLLGFLRF